MANRAYGFTNRVLDLVFNFFNNYGISLFFTVLFIVGGFVAIKLLKPFSEKALNKANIKDRFIINMVKKVIVIGVWFTVIVLVLQSFKISVAGVFMALSPIFFTLGFGLKDLIMSLIKSVQLKILNPYKVGDDIEIDGVKGKVEQVDFLYTYMKTNDGGLMTVSNSRISDNKITNFTQKKTTLPMVELGKGKVEKKELK